MEQRFDREEMIERVNEIAREIRRSEAYPALVGGIAGGIAGALVAAMIAARLAPPRSESASQPSTPSAGQGSRNNLAMRDMVQMLAIVAGLAKQVREWYYQEKGKH